jgi:serine/threonine-protein kinase HipA
MERFDRIDAARVPFMSAMTALDAKDHSDDRSYLEILDVIRQVGASPTQDARQLWRRMAFNVLTSNVDDHLRNHGFLWTGNGWRLSPAYDMNPTPPHINPRIHVLALNELDHTASIETVMSVAKDFGLKLTEAKSVAFDVATSVSGWKTAATRCRLSKDDLEFMSGAFEHHDMRDALAMGATKLPSASPASGGSRPRGAAENATKKKGTKKGAARSVNRVSRAKPGS